MPLFVVVTGKGGGGMYGRAHAGAYRDIAVVEIDTAQAVIARLNGQNWRPKRINSSEPGVVRIVKRWNSCFVGTTPQCRYNVAMSEAQILCEKLNAASRDNALDCANHRD